MSYQQHNICYVVGQLIGRTDATHQLIRLETRTSSASIQVTVQQRIEVMHEPPATKYEDYFHKQGEDVEPCELLPETVASDVEFVSLGANLITSKVVHKASQPKSVFFGGTGPAGLNGTRSATDADANLLTV